MKQSIQTFYKAEKTADNMWHVSRIRKIKSGPWFNRKTREVCVNLGQIKYEKDIQHLINMDIREISPDKILETNTYDSRGKSTNTYGW